MISDKKELLIAFHENGISEESGEKKKHKTAAIWTNYSAFVWTLQICSPNFWKKKDSQKPKT